ncbi:GH23532, partial [Drosophila grimshawi]
ATMVVTLAITIKRPCVIRPEHFTTLQAHWHSIIYLPQPQHTAVSAQSHINSSSICQRTAKISERSSSSPSRRSTSNKWAWNIAHTPRVTHRHWTMLICIVILAGSCLVAIVKPKLLLLPLHFIGSRIAFSISAAHRQHLMLTFWAVGNKVAALLPQIYTAATQKTTSITATKLNTFAVLCLRKYSR